MFLHMPTLKKLMKAAFNKNSLTVGMMGDGLFVEGGAFTAWFDWNFIPNKVKGAIMELAGELPTESHAFKAGKEGNQYELPWNPYWDIQEQLRRADKRYVVTPIVLDDQRHGAFRFLQQADAMDNIKVISEQFTHLIDYAEIDTQNGEGSPQGPFSTKQGDMFYWSTDFCILGVCACKLYRGLSLKVQNTISEIDFESDYASLEGGEDLSQSQY